MISLLFVMAAMLEFAGMMLLQRENEIRGDNMLSINGRSERRGSIEMKRLWTKIDGIAMFLFSFAYVVFNIAYWVNLLVQF